MPVHLQREVEQLKRISLSLGARVEQNVATAVRSLVEQDVDLAGQVKHIEKQIDQDEVQVEEECLKILALHQPVATDLRFIVSVLKVNADLERIDDLAKSIAERTLWMQDLARPPQPLNLRVMGDRARAMLRQSLDALVQWDAAQARAVIPMDDEVDGLNREHYQQIKQGLKEGPDHVEALICLLFSSRCLERIADLAVNIAQDVIYMIEGDIVRHRKEV